MCKLHFTPVSVQGGASLWQIAGSILPAANRFLLLKKKFFFFIFLFLEFLISFCLCWFFYFYYCAEPFWTAWDNCDDFCCCFSTTEGNNVWICFKRCVAFIYWFILDQVDPLCLALHPVGSLWGPSADAFKEYISQKLPASIKGRNWRITSRGKANDCHGHRKPIYWKCGREAWRQNLPLSPSVRGLNKGNALLLLLLSSVGSWENNKNMLHVYLLGFCKPR